MKADPVSDGPRIKHEGGTEMKNSQETSRRWTVALVGISMLTSVTAGWSQPPPTVIDNPVARIVLDHTTGNVTSLTYYGGSGQDIVDPYWGADHAGLCRLNNETTTVSHWEYVGTSGIEIRYTGSYGNKELKIVWGDGVLIHVRWYLDAPYLDQWYNAWEPGGTNGDGNDRFAVEGYEGTYNYSGGWTLRWEGKTSWTAMTDLDHDEVFGYRFCSPMHVRHANGVSVDHYIHDLTNGPEGFFATTFAVKNRQPGGDWWQAIAELPLICDGALPVEGETWGTVKALYR
jgi:hypothetical protein